MILGFSFIFFYQDAIYESLNNEQSGVEYQT